MSRATWTHAVFEAHEGRGEDRVAIITRPGRVIAVVADGAGGISGGAEAAETICKALSGYVDSVPFVEWLAVLDRSMASTPNCGQAAVVVVEIFADGTITGASVGDCEAQTFSPGVVFTDNQHHKPLLGSGEATPVPFKTQLDGGTLVLATDGLWKYANMAKIAEATAVRPLDSAVTKLVDAVRLKSGDLQDDVGIFIYEATK